MSNTQAAAVVVMATTSAVMWWFWWRRWKTTGAIWPKVELAHVPLNPLVVVLALGMIGLSLVAAILPVPANDRDSLLTVDKVWHACLLNGILVLALLPTLIGSDVRRLAAFGFGLANWRRQLTDGLEAALASILPVLAMLLVTSPFRSQEETHEFLRLLQEDASLKAVSAVLLAAVVLAPLLEELLFRVILLEWLKTRMTAVESIVVSSTAFAVVHGPLDSVALLPLAILLGSLYDARRSFWSVFVAHACFNLWNIVLTMSSG